MPMDDLYKALSMFKDGAQELATSRAIAGAHDQVQSIRQTEMDEMQKRQAYSNIANDLVSRMAQFGTPTTTMAAAQSAIAPPSITNANQANLEALMTGSPQLADLAQKQQTFETNPKFELAKLKAAQSPVENEFKKMKFEEVKNQFNERTMDKIFKDANPSQSSRNSMALLQRSLNRIGEAEAIIHGDPSKITRQQIEELPVIINSTLNQGASTVSGVEHMRPAGLNLQLAKLQEMASSSPQPANIPGFVDMYASTIQRMKDVAISQVRGDVKASLKSTGAGMIKRDPEAFRTRADELLKPYGDSVTAVDAKTGKITFKSDEDESALTKVLDAVVSNSKDPRAQEVLRRASEDPAFIGALRTNPKLNAKVRGLRKQWGI
jgi:hypothetical protein